MTDKAIDEILQQLFDMGYWSALNSPDSDGVHHVIAATQAIQAEIQKQVTLGKIELVKEYASVARTISTRTVHEQVFINDLKALQAELESKP